MVDYSKFDKIVDSDEEGVKSCEASDENLGNRHRVASECRPVSGRQTPNVSNEPADKAGHRRVDAAARQEQHQPVLKQAGLGRCGRFFYCCIRLFEILAWLMPLTLALMHYYLQFAAKWSPQHAKAELLAYAGGDAAKRVEELVYPSIMTLCLLLGLFDASLAWLALTSSEGPARVAWACWAKRTFLSLTFLAYEAQYPSPDVVVLRMSVRTGSGLLLAACWTTRKVVGYSKEVYGLVMKPELVGWRRCHVPSGSNLSPLVPGGRGILALEAVMELSFLIVHLALLPTGTALIGLHEPIQIRAVCLSVLIFFNWSIFRIEVLGNRRDAPKKERVD